MQEALCDRTVYTLDSLIESLSQQHGPTAATDADWLTLPIAPSVSQDPTVSYLMYQ